MTLMNRVRVTYTGGVVVGPAVSTYYFSQAHTGFVADLFAFYDAVKDRFPSSLSWQIPNVGDVIDADDGSLAGAWTDGSSTGGVGLATNQCPAGVGLRIVWNTLGTTNGRRVRGSTFYVPLDATMYGTDGSLSSSITQWQSAASTLVTASTNQMLIWTRPRENAAGGVNSVISATVPDKVTTLRSRRT